MQKTVRGIRFKTKKEKGFSGEAMYANGKYLTNIETTEEFEKEIADYMEYLTEKESRISAGAKAFTHRDIAQLFENYCTLNGITYSTNNAMSGSIYITAKGKVFRFSNHARFAEARANFNNAQYDFDMPDGLLLESEITTTFKNLLK